MYEKRIYLSPTIQENISRITRNQEGLEQIFAGAVFALVYAYVFDVEEVSVFFPGKWKNSSVVVTVQEKMTLKEILFAVLEKSKEARKTLDLTHALAVGGPSSSELLKEDSSTHKLTFEAGVYSFLLHETRGEDLLPVFFQRILEKLDEYLDLPFKDIHLEDAQEKEKIEQWSQKKAVPIERFYRLFQEALKTHGKRTAYRQDDRATSYHELHALACTLEQQLRSSGVVEDDAVAVECANDPWTIISVLAIARLGAIYVPLDKNLPAVKKENILKDSGAIKLLRQGQILDQSVKEEEAQTLRKRNKTLLHGEAGSYIVYTSGTTGQPKGCIVSEKNMMNLCHWYEKEFQIKENSKVILLNNFSFDASIKNIYTPLLCGAEIVFGPEHAFDTFALSKILLQHHVSHLNCVPGLFDALLKTTQYENYRQLESLRYVILGGETFLLAEIKKWARLTRCLSRFANVYGPAECTSVSTYYHCSKEELLTLDEMPIGYPIEGKKLYLINSKGKLCLPSMVGEVYLGGQGLTAGYTKPSLGEGKFIDDSSRFKHKVYATGDLAHYDSQGRLYYLGRKDHQVKVNGQRIELEEIESHLRSCLGVVDAAMIVGKEGLLAFYTSRSGKLKQDQFKEELKKSLFESTLPKDFYYLREMPRNDNGKIDRKELSQLIPKEKEEATLPQGELTTKLVEAWQNTLEKKDISTSSGFFDQGGSSLLLYKLKLEIKQVTGYDLELVDLLAYSSIDQLEQWLSNQKHHPQGETHPYGIKHEAKPNRRRKRMRNDYTRPIEEDIQVNPS